MLLKIDRPVIAFDVETHDLVTPEDARIVEIGFIHIFPDGKSREWSSLVKPDQPISDKAVAIHHITAEMIQDAPTFRQLAANIAKGFSGCDFAGYNIKFDLRVLQGEMNRAEVKWSYTDARLIDGLRLWQVSEPRSLSDAVRRFLQREPSDAHRALGDAKDAWMVIDGMLGAFEKLPRDVQAIHDLCFPRNPDWLDEDGKIVWKGNDAVLSFGKWSGISLATVDRGYLNWMLNGSFSESVKAIVQRVLNGETLTKES